METLKKNPSIRRRTSKFARTFQKVCSLRTTSTKVSSSMLKSKINFDSDSDSDLKSTTSSTLEMTKTRERRRAVLEAVVAKIFASTTSIKASYAELQMAQRPYDNSAIQTADTSIVEELRSLSELKRSFVRNELNHISPQVAIMLAEIQEQQSLMRSYELTIKKLESQIREKETKIVELNSNHNESVSSLQKKIDQNELKADSRSRQTKVSPRTLNLNLNLNWFVEILGFSLRSVRSFVKMLVREMESAEWDLNAAASAVVSTVAFTKPSHRCFAFESFVNRKMLEGFGEKLEGNLSDEFKNLRSVNPVEYLTRNPDSLFAGFVLRKYLGVVHAKMECSLFGNLNQRKVVSSGGFPGTGFFAAFCEMAKWVWLLHCAAFSLSGNVAVFQIRRGCRFSHVYMESVEPSGEGEADMRVGFTVVPGFKIGGTVVQSQVYLARGV